MKMKLSWHKQNLTNFEKHLAREECELERLQKNVERMKLEVEFRRKQIEEAERRGLDSFDVDRLLVKRSREG